ncbi:hypothetical protein PPYR_11685 [Photinus pyralis]|uniref:Serpin domain-containing protein n=1 Tax=Photinus pyralis TaxID=7054 RepID=A0A1Y1LLC4_PHOPY|nr:antichymotrypsin-2-like [Photinus pyralis]KAB0794846.1 hypothetical protein PPYR_11685 [Photinus pyralis]
MKLQILLLGITSVYCLDSSFRDANRQFTTKLYKELVEQKQEKLLVSPMAIQIIFSLLRAGSGGLTSEELSDALSLPRDDKAQDDMVKGVLEAYKTVQGDHYQLTLANKIYVQEDVELKASYKSKAVDVFGADVENVDFKKKENAMAVINKWVDCKTKHTIPEIVTKDDLNDALRLILLNTVYFQAPWRQRFHEPSQKPFFVDSSNTVNVDMMSDRDLYEYHESDELKAKFLKIPYRVNGMSMVMALPNEKDGLGELEKRLGDILALPKFSYNVVIVSFPKFQFDATIKLKPILNAMGIKDAFTSSANFSGISESASLSVSDAIQKNHIEVNEKGTIASSATAVLLFEYSGLVEVEPPKEFKADHPFIFFIESEAGILFIGKFTGH